MNECRNHTEDHNDEYLQDLVHKLTTNAKHLKIAHLNVRGLRKKVDEIKNPSKAMPFRRIRSNRNALE